MDAQTLDNQTIDQAIAVLKNGGVVVFPTETAYGLAADATNTTAVNQIFLLKGRGEEKSLPLIAADRAMVETIAGIPRALRSLADRYWPGPLTLVLPVISDQLDPAVVRHGTVAVRVSSHSVAQALSRGIGRPIVSTSANRSGEPVCYSVECVKKQFESQEIKPDYYLDAGTLTPEPSSTIVGLDDYGIPEILRQGSIEI